MNIPKLYSKFCLPLLLLLCIVSGTVYAQENGAQLSAEIKAAHSSGKTFTPVRLFNPASGNTHTDFVNGATLFTEDITATASLFTRKPEAISLTVTDAKGNSYQLEMLRSNPFAADANNGYIDAGGRHNADFDHGLHYQGSVAGAGRSMASMSVFANGDIMILFANGDGNYIIGRLEDGSGKYILYNDKDVRNRPYIPCGVSDTDYPKTKKDLNNAAKGTAAYQCNKVRVYWEVDYQMYTSKGSLVNTQNYMAGLFNQFQALYRNERIAVELKSLYIWTSSDFYPDTSSNVGLDMFKAYWNSMNDAFDGDVAHLITKDAHNNGGLGYVGVLCNKTYAYAYSEIYGTYSTVPTYSWDVEVVTHETGHNLGSMHTHWCGWNTGTGGSCGSIDNCYTQESSTGCTTCGETYNKNVGGFTGTIMSYCHLTSIGINLANGFGPLPGDLIRNDVDNSSCLANIFSVNLTPADVCSSDGSVTLTFNSNNFGTAPYTYSWSNGASSQSIFNLTSAGTYAVTIVDSNGCSDTYSTTVNMKPKPGNGAAITDIMPICCGHSTKTITMKASVPQNLTQCQTVAWLRTTTPVTTYSAAQTAFAAAQSTDINYSSNAGSISATTGAQLVIAPPDSCNTAVTYYYTPFVSRKQKSSTTVSDSATTAAVYTITNNVTIGSYTQLGTQTAATCDLVDTPSVQALTVTITGYTGRPGKMTLLVQDQDMNILYRQLNLTGNGTYTIPMNGFTGGPLQSLYVSAFDFNCAFADTCISSQLSIGVKRTVTYPAVTQPTFEKGCTVGTSVMVQFAPNSCTTLDVSTVSAANDAISIYPNPANSAVTIAYQATVGQELGIKITDLVGKTVSTQQVHVNKGKTEIKTDIRGWAKGVYFISVNTGNGQPSVYKLVVE